MPIVVLLSRILLRMRTRTCISIIALSRSNITTSQLMICSPIRGWCGIRYALRGAYNNSRYYIGL